MDQKKLMTCSRHPMKLAAKPIASAPGSHEKKKSVINSFLGERQNNPKICGQYLLILGRISAIYKERRKNMNDFYISRFPCNNFIIKTFLKIILVSQKSNGNSLKWAT